MPGRTTKNTKVLLSADPKVRRPFSFVIDTTPPLPCRPRPTPTFCTWDCYFRNCATPSPPFRFLQTRRYYNLSSADKKIKNHKNGRIRPIFTGLELYDICLRHTLFFAIPEDTIFSFESRKTNLQFLSTCGSGRTCRLWFGTLHSVFSL